jgi:hypothetical protein
MNAQLISIIAASSKPINNNDQAKNDSAVKTEATEKDEIAKTEKGIALTVGTAGIVA